MNRGGRREEKGVVGVVEDGKLLVSSVSEEVREIKTLN